VLTLEGLLSLDRTGMETPELQGGLVSGPILVSVTSLTDGVRQPDRCGQAAQLVSQAGVLMVKVPPPTPKDSLFK
jgi:hypothetical protein